MHFSLRPFFCPCYLDDFGFDAVIYNDRRFRWHQMRECVCVYSFYSNIYTFQHQIQM